MYKKSRLALYSIIYAVIYTFCLYKNTTGITFPLFIVATFVFGNYCFKETGTSIKKDSLYMIPAIILIGISQFLTDNSFIHSMNILIVFTLLIYFFMHQYVNDRDWDLLCYLKGILFTFIQSVLNIAAPFKDYSNYSDSEEAHEKSTFPWKTVLLTILFASPALIIVVMLLSTADVLFANIFKEFYFPNIGTLIGILFLTVIVFLISYGMIAFLTKKPFAGFNVVKEKADSAIAITVAIMFNIVYLVFSFIQVFGLFIGNFSLPEGITYAEYAREGFFQLLVVCIFNLVLVIIGSSKFKNNRALKILLTITCFCTFIMVGSSAFRMILYIRYYYFTFYRLLVLWTLLLITALMTEVVISIWCRNFKLFKTALFTAILLYLFLAFSHAEYFVAKWNVNEQTSHSEFFLASSDYKDVHALKNLSLDAAPVVIDYLVSKGDDSSAYQTFAIKQEINFRNFNLSKYIAKKACEK